MFKPSCYSCRKKFEPSALRVSYSKNYCEGCGVGLFGEDYFNFAPKPAPTTRKNLVVHGAVVLLASAFFLLWLSIGGLWQPLAQVGASCSDSRMMTPGAPATSRKSAAAMVAALTGR